jgi:hypothetical protein
MGRFHKSSYSQYQIYFYNNLNRTKNFKKIKMPKMITLEICWHRNPESGIKRYRFTYNELQYVHIHKPIIKCELKVIITLPWIQFEWLCLLRNAVMLWRCDHERVRLSYLT